MRLVTGYDHDFKEWTARAEKIIKRYKDETPETGNTSQSKYSILWSNVQTLVPATYNRLPQPDVSRRFRDNDPVGRVGALILERALDYDIQHYGDFKATMDACVLDRFLPGRGTAWARYEPKIGSVEEADSGAGESGEQVSDDVEAAEELEYECAVTDYVHWKDFGHNVARTWGEVHTVWRVVYMSREGMVERFGEEDGNLIPLDARPDTLGKLMEKDEETRGKIYEFWTKNGNKAVWVSKSLGKVLDERDDPLGLEEFFPCPKPLFATITNDSLVPVPDYKMYQDQARQLDKLEDKIDGLIEALQVKGVYNAEFPELARLFTEGQNTNLLPIKNFAAFAEKNGLSGAIDLVDLKPIYECLQACFTSGESILQKIYGITGIADIIRGQSEAQETAAAQVLKGQFASLRLNAMKHCVAQFATDILRLKAQIMLNKFDPTTLLQIAAVDQLTPEDQQMIPQAMELLKNKAMEGFRIDIAADSLVQLDEAEEKVSRTEYTKMVVAMLQQIEPIVNTQPQLAALAIGLLKFSITPFKAGKTIEGLIDQTLEKIQAKAKQMEGQPPPPPPQVQAAQIKAQADAQAKGQAAQIGAQADAAKAQVQLQTEQQKIATESAAREKELRFEAMLEQQRQTMEAQRAQQQAQYDALLKRFEIIENNRTKIDVAEIAAGAQISAAQTSAAAAATGEQ